MTLSLHALTVRYNAGPDALTAVDAVTLSIPPRGALGLVGESGCGKSSVARAMIGLAPITSGTIHLDGTDITAALNTTAIHKKIQIVFQDPGSSLNPRMKVGAAIVEAMGLRTGLSPTQKQTTAARLFDLLRLPHASMNNYPHQFSGGQRQRIAIARALAVAPDYLICDEITSALDVSVQATILNLLKELQRELGLAMLFISHDLAAVRHMSDRVAVMYLGRIVEDAPADALFRTPRHPYTRALIDAVPRIGAPRATPLPGDIADPRTLTRGCRFAPRCPVGPLTNPDRAICLQQDPSENAAQHAHRAACHFV